MYRKLLPVCLALILAACQTHTPFPASFTGKAKINEYELEITCEGTGEPTIILENGANYKSWDETSTARFSGITRTCRYLRAGMGAKISGRRTAQDLVNDLHELLKQNLVPGPYIIVGHSIAETIMVLYTDQYPQDVAGLVCVDCWPSTYMANYLEKLSAPDLPDSPQKRDYLEGLQNWSAGKSNDWVSTLELLDGFASDKQVLEVASLGDIPFVVLVNGGEWALLDMDKLGYQAWLSGAETLSKLSTHSRLEVVPQTTHLTIIQDAAVDKAIQEVYDAVTEP